MSDPKLDDLRQQLRALGYLDAGVDRFLLAPARSTRGALALASRASLRVGVLGGILLGPAAAAGLGARLPGLISGPRDAVVVAIYLGVLFFLALAATAFVVSAGATRLVDRGSDRFAQQGRRVSRLAGGLIAATSLLYLTFWWRNANAGFGWSAPWWTAFALLVAVGISLLLGHAVRITTLAVLAAGSEPGVPLPRVAATSWTTVAAGAALAFAGAAAVLIVTAPGDAGTAGAEPLTVVSAAGHRVRLVAIDGFDPATYSQLGAALPNLAFAMSGRRVSLQPQDTSDPARAWTTIATGVTPDAHGVHALETRRITGLRGVLQPDSATGRVIGGATDLVRLTRPSLASRDERKAKTIWEVAEQAGLRTAVVNWWATWPAPATGAVVVTDRAVLRLERGGSLDGEISPPDLYPSLRGVWPEIRRRSQEAATRAFPERTDVAAVLRRSAELDATIAGVAQAVPAASLDLFVIYFPGLDIAQNALLGSAAGELPPSAIAARVEALHSYYAFLDRTLQPLLAPADKQTLMLVTQPGRVHTSAGGLFVVAPPSRDAVLAEGTTVNMPPEGSTALDIAPTIWWRLGLPLSRELAGQPATLLFGSGPAAVDRYVTTYGRPFAQSAARAGQPLDKEMLDRLRSLGYLK